MALNELGVLQPGALWTPWRLGGLNAVRRRMIPFSYTIVHAAIAASGINPLAAAVQISDRAFVWTHWMVTIPGSTSGWAELMRDQASGVQFMNQRVCSLNLFAQGPIPLPVPWVFGPQSAIYAEGENLDTGSTRTAYVTLSGYLLDPPDESDPLAPDWTRYGHPMAGGMTPYGWPMPGESDRAPAPFYFDVTSASILVR